MRYPHIPGAAERIETNHRRTILGIWRRQQPDTPLGHLALRCSAPSGEEEREPNIGRLGLRYLRLRRATH